MKINWKKIIGISTAVFGTTFVAVSVVARKKKSDSNYKNDTEQKNLMEGKKVIFVENEEELENADGVKGHLEAVGDLYRNIVEIIRKLLIRGITDLCLAIRI